VNGNAVRSRKVQPRRNCGVAGKERTQEKPCEQGALAQRNRRSVSENAPLKNRFGKRSRSRWTGVPSAKSAKLRLISSRNKTNDVDVGSERERIGRGRAARRNKQSRTQDFATLDSALLIVLRWRRIRGSTGMTLRHLHRRCVLQCAQSAVIRNAEPSCSDEQDERQTQNAIAKQIRHGLELVARIREMFKSVIDGAVLCFVR